MLVFVTFIAALVIKINHIIKVDACVRTLQIMKHSVSYFINYNRNIKLLILLVPK